MSVRRAAIVFVSAVYVFLWVIALHGARQLIGPLAVPPILALLVAVGVWLDRLIGLKPRSQKFKDDDDASA
jgi:hypothetical protein